MRLASLRVPSHFAGALDQMLMLDLKLMTQPRERGIAGQLFERKRKYTFMESADGSFVVRERAYVSLKFIGKGGGHETSFACVDQSGESYPQSIFNAFMNKKLSSMHHCAEYVLGRLEMNSLALQMPISRFPNTIRRNS